MDNRLSTAEVEQLIRCFPSVDPARRLLAEAGLRTEVPGDDARALWHAAADLLAAGAVAAGRLRLLEAARREFPDNPVFAQAGAATATNTTYYQAGGNQVVINQPSGPITLDHVLTAPTAGTAGKTVATKVFFAGASPFDISLDRLRADREFREIQRHERPDVLAVSSRHAAGIDDLNAALVERPDILHLACHYAEGTLRFEDPVGDPHPVAVEALAQRLDAYRRHAGFTLSGLVFSVCESADFAERFTGLADTVVAWKGMLDDDCAIAFAGRLYRELGRDPGQSLGNAARLAAVEVATSDNACHNLGDQLLVVPV